ncbi:MAG: protein kinase [Terriglobales bacterium]
MGLTSGHKLGPYEIQSPLGAGGMGEVYRAKDTRLDRTVAVKVLLTHLTANPDLRARFEREARAISALQHPNICVLHDVGCQDGVDFLVMEYLEGETLAMRLARKPLATDEALKISIEIADALEKAHRAGIVHRDLKPGNVMLTKGGAKLMDFGLAKPNALATGPGSGTPSISSMATMAGSMANLAGNMAGNIAGTMSNMASPVTVAGTMVGTVQYMSPEQIQGKEADARSDIFAFGAMLYEMLAGKRAFEGKSQLSVASAILDREPEPLSTVQPLTPPALEQIVRTCLAKEPEDRFQSAHDLKLQLQWIAGAGSQIGAPAIVTSHRKSASKILTAAMATGWLAAIAAAVLAIMYAGRLNSAQQPVHASLEPPPGFELSRVITGAPALSPDGKQIALLMTKPNLASASLAVAPHAIDTYLQHTIFVRNIDSNEVTSLPGTDGALFPFWSPDSKYIGFFADGKLKKILASGGPAQTLCDAPDGRGGTWNERGTIIFSPRISGPLQSVSDGGGTPVEVTRRLKDVPEFTHRNPYFLPDGKHFLYVQSGGNTGRLNGVYAASLDGGEPIQILPVGSNVVFSDGYLFYVKDGTLTAQAFNPLSLRFEGNAISIAAGIEFHGPRNLGYFSVSRNLLLYRKAVVEDRELVSLDNAGKVIDRWGEPAPYIGYSFSSGSQMAVLSHASSNGGEGSLWLADPQRKTVQRLTADTGSIESAVVSSDGNSVFIATSAFSSSTLVRRSLTASGNEEKMLDGLQGSYEVSSVSRDGRYLFMSKQDSKTSWDIYYMDLQGERKLIPLLTGPYAERGSALSPDNKWLAYTSDETGKVELYVTPFPSAGSKWQVSSNGVSGEFDWSSDSKNLRYREGDKVYNVEVHATAGRPDFSPPKEIMGIPANAMLISISSDGKRTLAAVPVSDSAATPIDFILNWQHLVH